MSRKKKKQSNVQNPSPATQIPVSSSAPLPTPDEFSRRITFDSLEDKIRGEEMLQQQEQKRAKEERDIKKKLEATEVERRMEELRRQLGIKK